MNAESTRSEPAADHAASPGRARRLIGTLLVYFVALVLMGSGTAKIGHLPPVVKEMASLNLSAWKLNAVGALEIFTGFLFLVSPWRSIGLLMASAYLGAAACAHFMSDQYTAIGPAVFLIGCCWIGTSLKHPQVLWSFALPHST